MQAVFRMYSYILLNALCMFPAKQAKRSPKLVQAETETVADRVCRAYRLDGSFFKAICAPFYAAWFPQHPLNFDVTLYIPGKSDFRTHPLSFSSFTSSSAIFVPPSREISPSRISSTFPYRNFVAPGVVSFITAPASPRHSTYFPSRNLTSRFGEVSSFNNGLPSGFSTTVFFPFAIEERLCGTFIPSTTCHIIHPAERSRRNGSATYSVCSEEASITGRYCYYRQASKTTNRSD